MKFISWNVNGLRAAVKHGFQESFNQLDADFFCIQETKLQEGQIEIDLPGYEQFWNYAERKGYSGTAIFSRHEPLSVHYGIDVPEFDDEGRVITLEFGSFFLVTAYVPNSGQELKRLEYRQAFNLVFQDYLLNLSAKKSVILCGDLNVAHTEIDLKNPKSNHHAAGFTDEERRDFTALLNSGFTDTFRFFNPELTGAYSWWSYRFHSRDRNAGWRIDYFVTSADINDQLQDAKIHDEVMGSDHCPVEVDINL